MRGRQIASISPCTIVWGRMRQTGISGQVGVVAAGGGAVRQMTHLTRQAAAITWTPDSAHITYISGEWSDRGLVGGEIFTVPLAGGEVRNLTPGALVCYSWCRWYPDQQRLLYACWSGVTHQLGILNAVDGTTTLVDGDFIMGDPPCDRFFSNGGYALPCDDALNATDCL